jgi:hypothetical protein
MLKPCSATGYSRINLIHKDSEVSIAIHILVAKYFLENPKIFPMVHHKDENRSNNHYANLEYVNNSKNTTASCGNGNSKSRAIIYK